MIEIKEKSNCTGCHACANACPKNCISMVSDEEGFWYPQAEKAKCIDCGLCVNVCPIIHKRHPDDSCMTTAIAAINLNEEIRLRSSSGGIFTLLAENIIAQGGVVFGAAFADDFKSVRHICVNDIADLDKLRGSKYVQSKIGDTYKQAKDYLDSGRKVLFTGTPCQIGGLYSYLRTPYENLFTQDIICHGVPSPMVWEKYVVFREKQSASATQRMFFRHKKYGWKTYAVLFEFSNNTAYVKKLHEDSYMKAFLSNSCLRPSCYACSFKGIKRQADITLADFWGIQNVLPEMDDDKGTSLVLVHSYKGRYLLDKLSDKIKSQAVDIDIVEKYNPSVINSVVANSKREDFLKDIHKDAFEITVLKYTKKSFLKRLRSAIIKIARTFKHYLKE
ncbi:Coenzyme F420 hydrogenase/dehydrogenase, beta subunit C-terminal domain [Ruminococcus sp.]|jgi:coenzyme F420-reducing hydrogenase beta subunit|uniref:Coenzyme F420 hydrogenase/dehydrogenase, beta subunit C-terminal domain n=1 Tax=Ruminococcus sp. TaxID=41978 RepID=UPI0026013436|nr:Coenzyme F420 hydrogenase/dehydrogenase, beta subunit C-terminal domain [Ruminococcus sp.]